MNIKDTWEVKMKKAIENLQIEFTTVKTGRVSISILDTVKVEYYGSLLPINQVASISVPEPRTIEVKPWDKNVLSEIEKAILKSNLGLVPNNDGKIIRVTIPLLTEERRKELIKVVGRIAEDSKISIRNIRREANDEIDKNKVSEDETKRLKNETQKSTDNFISEIDKILSNKEKEILEV